MVVLESCHVLLLLSDDAQQLRERGGGEGRGERGGKGWGGEGGREGREEGKVRGYEGN